MQQQQDPTPYGTFRAIDENTIFHGGGGSELGGRMLRSRLKSPMSDLNPVPPMALPDLRPVSRPKTRLKNLPVLTSEHYTSLLHWV
jgi:hypothetical protein